MSGPVFVASVVSRRDWTCDIHLVGHENSVAVAAFSPRLFRERDDPRGSATVIALGSVDQSVSVWITGQSRPILVARDVFQRQVMDLSWSSDGLTLYACSADGHIAAFAFTVADLLEQHPDIELQRAKELFGFSEQQRLFKRSTLQQPQSNSLGRPAQGTMERPTMLVPRKAGVPQANRPRPGLPAPANGRVQRLDQQISITNDGKRRIKPTLLNDSSSSDSGYELVSYTQSVLPMPATAQRTSERASIASEEGIDGEVSSFGRGVKRTASLSFSHDTNMAATGKKIKDIGRTLGADMHRTPAGPAVPLHRNEYTPAQARSTVTVLPLPLLLSVYRREEARGTMEARNHADGRPCEIFFYEATSSQAAPTRSSWIDFSPSAVFLATVSDEFSAVAFEDCSLAMYSCKGRRTCSMQLDAPVCRLESYKDFLLAVTTDGFLHRWNVLADGEMGRPISVLGILASTSAARHDEISQLWLHSTGLPVVITRSEKAFTLDTRKSAWVLIASGWFADCSSLWEGRTRGRGASMDSISGGNLAQARREPIRAIESEINDLVVIQRAISGVERASKPPVEAIDDFHTAVTLKHFEMRLQGAALLDSEEEYKTFLRAYAKKMSDEGLRSQAEDLCRSLLGPVYYAPNRAPSWEASVCGLEKRALLADVLKVMAKGRLLLGLVQTYQDLLRNVSVAW